jgi:hypothetical protein
MLHAAHQRNGLRSPGGMRLPLVGHRRPLDGLLRRQHIGFEREHDIDWALALQVGYCCPIDTPTIFEEQIPSAQHRGLL